VFVRGAQSHCLICERERKYATHIDRAAPMMRVAKTPEDAMADSINAIVFPGGFNLPLWAAEKQGLFARRNLDVKLHLTTSSMEQLSGLIKGDWDLALTGVDNVVAYQE